eukprot:7461208-Lingulodinium_polyedra.AAC.1
MCIRDSICEQIGCMAIGEEQAEEAYVAMAHRAKTWKQNKQFKQQLQRDRPSRDRPRLEGNG